MIDQIWERKWLTNNGDFLVKFENQLGKYLGSPHTSVVTSGTSALQMALKTLGPRGGEIITTPFSYVATTSSIVWEGLKPIFVDIEEDFLGIDPQKVTKKISSETRAILATHVYGNPCLIEDLEEIAHHYGITLIFDGAHAFGSTYKGKSLLTYGDISTLSFHATKLFHTINGGAIVCQKEETKVQIDRYRNFGHVGINEFDGEGVNAKMCEFHSAMGLLNLNEAIDILSKRKSQWEFYEGEISKRKCSTLKLREREGFNASYFPVFFDKSADMLEAISKAEKNGIELRRYFYPSLNTLNYVESESCPRSESISSRVCCLPLYHDLTISEQEEVIRIVNKI